MIFVNIFKDFYVDLDFYDNYYDNDRKYMNILIEQSEKSNFLDDMKQKMIVYNDWNEVVKVWKNMVLFLWYVLVLLVINVIKCQNCEVNKLEELDNNFLLVKCVGEDFDIFFVLSWKVNVEQGMYCYVINNVYYWMVKILDYYDR